MLSHLLLAVALASPMSDDQLIERMSFEHRNDTTDAGAFAELEPDQAVTGEEVVYHRKGDIAVSGYLARPVTGQDGQPAVIVIHEWWGLNDNIRHMADLLAGRGYTALAVDLYSGDRAETPEAARELMSRATANRADLQANLQSAHAYLTEDGDRPVGTIGWCFGGGWSLQSALLIPEVDASVIYYGRVPADPAELEPLQAPVLGLFGSEDGGIPVSSVEAFQDALAEAGKNGKVVIYEGAHHAFANPSGNRYHPDAARDAWNRTLAFFAEHLKRDDPALTSD